MILMLPVLAASGCGGGGSFPVAVTTGTVMCEGRPVPHAMVFFEPLASGESSLAGKQGTAVADEHGKFSISTYKEGDGAVVGKHRVRVGTPNRELYPQTAPCPCELNPESDVMQVEVTKAGKNEFEIVLTKKAPRQKPSLEELEAQEEAKQARLENRTQ
jgi:hypothetical protein